MMGSERRNRGRKAGKRIRKEEKRREREKSKSCRWFTLMSIMSPPSNKSQYDAVRCPLSRS